MANTIEMATLNKNCSIPNKFRKKKKKEIKYRTVMMLLLWTLSRSSLVFMIAKVNILKAEISKQMF